MHYPQHCLQYFEHRTHQNILMDFQSSTFMFRHTMEMWISHNKSLSGIICLWPSFTHFFPLLSSPSSSQAFFLFLFLLHCSRLCVEENQSQMLHGNRSKRIIPFLFLSPLPPPEAQSLGSIHVMCFNPGLCIHNTKPMITGLWFSPDYHRVAYKGHMSERIPGRNRYVSIMKDRPQNCTCSVKLLWSGWTKHEICAFL